MGIGVLLILVPFVPQVYSLDFSSSFISSSQFSINGSGYEDESLFVFDYIRFIDFVSSCFPCYISWPMVYWPCCSCGRKEARDPNNSSKLCGE